MDRIAPILLMTRPHGASERFVAQLPGPIAGQLVPLISPLIEIVPTVDTVDTGDARGLIFSSANGVATAAVALPGRDLPCFCVGKATTRAARAAGWQAQTAGATADDLVASLTRSRPPGPLLHLRGAHARGAIAERLTAAGCETRALSLYDQRQLPLSEPALDALAGPGPVIAPVFSPRTARQFANQHKGAAPLYFAALSQAVAGPLKSLNYNGLDVASQPDAAAMRSLVGQILRRVAG